MLSSVAPSDPPVKDFAEELSTNPPDASPAGFLLASSEVRVLGWLPAEISHSTEMVGRAVPGPLRRGEDTARSLLEIVFGTISSRFDE